MKEPIDDGMVPFNLFLVRNLFSGIIKYRGCEYRGLIKMIEERVIVHIIWIERTSSQDSRESQSMMEWFRSVDCKRAPCWYDHHQQQQQWSGEWVSSIVDYQDFVVTLNEYLLYDWRTSSWDSWESQSMMEWCRSIYFWWGTCSVVSSSSIAGVSIVDWSRWLKNELLCISFGLSVQVLKIHERANRWWNGAAQLIVRELPVDMIISSSRSSNDLESEYRRLLIYQDFVVTVEWIFVVRLTYKLVRFMREPIDDGMVPVNLFLGRNLFNGIAIVIIKYRGCEYRRLIKMFRGDDCISNWRTTPEDSRESQSVMEWYRSADYGRGTCSKVSSSTEQTSSIMARMSIAGWSRCFVVMIIACRVDVQPTKIHERANRWWNGAIQSIVGEVPVQSYHHQVSSVWVSNVIDQDDSWWWPENDSEDAVRLSVQSRKFHERANRWWNGAAQLIVAEAPVQSYHHQVSSVWVSNVIDQDDSCWCRVLEWRTSYKVSRESQLMMEQYQSVDCRRGSCAIVSSQSIECVSIECDWSRWFVVMMSFSIDVQVIKIHERANRGWNGAAQLIVEEEPVQ